MDAVMVDAMLTEVQREARLAERDRITHRLEAVIAQMPWLDEDARRQLVGCCGEGQQ